MNIKSSIVLTCLLWALTSIAQSPPTPGPGSGNPWDGDIFLPSTPTPEAAVVTIRGLSYMDAEGYWLTHGLPSAQSWLDPMNEQTWYSQMVLAQRPSPSSANPWFTFLAAIYPLGYWPPGTNGHNKLFHLYYRGWGADSGGGSWTPTNAWFAYNIDAMTPYGSTNCTWYLQVTWPTISTAPSISIIAQRWDEYWNEKPPRWTSTNRGMYIGNPGKYNGQFGFGDPPLPDPPLDTTPPPISGNWTSYPFTLLNVVSGSTYPFQVSSNLVNWLTLSNVTVGIDFTNGWQPIAVNLSEQSSWQSCYFRFSGTNWLNN